MMGQRQLVVDEARTWLRTPYHHEGRVKGSGVDCGQLIVEVFIRTGLVEKFDTGQYTHDWHLHRSEEKYLSYVERYLRRVDDTEDPLDHRDPGFMCLPGDVLVWRVGRTFSHGAIVTKWPYIVHASFPDRMVTEVRIKGTVMAEKPMRVYSYWGDKS